MSIQIDRVVSRRNAAWAVVPAIVLMLMVGCADQDPAAKVAAARAKYIAELNGFVVKQEPLSMEEAVEPAGEDVMAEATEMAPEEMESEEMESEEMMPEGPVPVVQDIILDIVVSHDSFDKLPGVTVDISMQDGSQAEKGSWKVWVETAALEKGNHLQITHLLEGVSYEEGDGFFVEVRSPIAPEEQGDYPEFEAGI